MISKETTNAIIKTFVTADKIAFNVQGVMKGILGKLYLSTIRFHIRNVGTDALRGVFEGYGGWRNTRQTAATLIKAHKDVV